MESHGYQPDGLGIKGAVARQRLGEQSEAGAREARAESLRRTLEEMLPHLLDGQETLDGAVKFIAESIANVDKTKSAPEVYNELGAILRNPGAKKRLDQVLNAAYLERVGKISKELLPAADSIVSQAQIREAAAEMVRRSVEKGVPESFAREQADTASDLLTREFRSVRRQTDVLKNEVSPRQFSDIRSILDADSASDFFRGARELRAVLPELIPSDAGKEAVSILVVEKTKQLLSDYVRLVESLPEAALQAHSEENELNFLSTPLRGSGLGSEQHPDVYQAELREGEYWRSRQRDVPALRTKLADRIRSLENPNEYHAFRQAWQDLPTLKRDSRELVYAWEGAGQAERVLRTFEDRLQSAMRGRR